MRRTQTTNRSRHVLRLFALHAPSTIVATLLVVAGFLTFPTVCRCGNEPPHPHALFLLPGHYHDPTLGGRPGRGYGGRPNATDEPAPLASMLSTPDGPRLGAPVPMGDTLLAVVGAADGASAVVRPPPAAGDGPLRTGFSMRPEHPPPRQAPRLNTSIVAA